MKTSKRFLVVIIAGLLVFLLCGAKKTSTWTCCKPGCHNKCPAGTYYCSIHKSCSNKKSNKSGTTKKSSTSKKNTGSSKNNRKRLTKKSYYTDDMPDCDDYENWGDFVDDWDGNMPDGSDASDYWDNW